MAQVPDTRQGSKVEVEWPEPGPIMTVEDPLAATPRSRWVGAVSAQTVDESLIKALGRRVGRKPAARTYDAVIAAIAISNDLPIHTCNPRDFTGIDGLTVVAVPHPDR